MTMLDQALQIADEMVRLRRDIHAHPELGFEEHRTAALVADMLRELGVAVTEGIGRTGVMATIGQGAGPIMAIRADMDALPIQETTGLPFSSTQSGVMHACGHDAHTAMLLGAAYLLQNSWREHPWSGSVRLLFQPSEESADEDGISGAQAMLADHALDQVDAVIALHVHSHLPTGICYLQDGYSLAAVDSFEAWIHGTGGHGAYPHETTDPLYMLAPILTALYAIPSRQINALRPNVVSLGEIHGGAASNVIPSAVYLHGTLRSYDATVRRQLHQATENVFKISQALGGSYTFKLQEGYPAMFNHAMVNGWLAGSARDLLGAQGVDLTHEFGMGAEDFAYMTQGAPGAMFMLGAALPDGRVRPHHTPDFDIDERCLPIGAAVLAETARRFVTGQVTSSTTFSHPPS